MEKAYILISCEIGEEQSLFAKLKKIPEITDCLIIYGDYDIVAKFQRYFPTNGCSNFFKNSEIRKHS